MTGQPGVERFCEWCGDPIPGRARRDATFCCRAHKTAARRKRRALEARGVTTTAGGYPTGPFEEGGYPDEDRRAGRPADARIADTRFRRLLDEQEVRDRPVVPVDLVELQRRNPGVVLPEITAIGDVARETAEARRAELRAISLDGRTQYTPQTPRDPKTQESFANRARSSRATNRRYDDISPKVSQQYQNIQNWSSIPDPAASPSAALGRRLPARYLNAQA